MFIEDMRERFIMARWCYLMGEPYLSDIEYDHLEKEYKALYPNDEYSVRGWAFDKCPVEILNKYNRADLICNPVMGYAAESIDSVNNEDDYNSVFGGLKEKSRLSFKIDGWNTRASYLNGNLVQVNTRGRSGNNMIYNEIAGLFPRKIKIKGRVAITGELNIPNNLWVTFKTLTGNVDQRASIRTALANASVAYLEFLAFDIFIENMEGKPVEDKYSLLKELGFKTPLFKWVSNKRELDAAVKFMSSLSSGYNYLTDGLVIENSSIQLAIRLGKWSEKVQSSYVVGYTETQGMYGTSLEVLMRPVVIGGRTCSRINITNIAQIVENELQIGSPIAFNIRSAANSVIDVTETFKLQQKYAGRYDEYAKMIDEREVSDA